MKIGNLTVSNTNGNARQRDAVRVYRDGAQIAVVYPRSRNPLAYLRAHPGSAYRAQLVNQLRTANVDVADILAIVS